MRRSRDRDSSDDDLEVEVAAAVNNEPVRRLRITYEIVDGLTGEVLESKWQKVVGAGEALVLRAEASWFHTVVG